MGAPLFLAPNTLGWFIIKDNKALGKKRRETLSVTMNVMPIGKDIQANLRGFTLSQFNSSFPAHSIPASSVHLSVSFSLFSLLWELHFQVMEFSYSLAIFRL